jgi:hypothetical protein
MACDQNAPGVFEQTVAYGGLLFVGGGMYGIKGAADTGARCRIAALRQ